MGTVTVIGTGNMGTAIAGLATTAGHSVQALASRETDVAVEGEIVVLAVPYPAVAEIIAQRGDSLAGRIVVDITNPLDFATFDALTVPADSSATAEIAAALPQSQVVKAFNTNFAATLGAGRVGELPTTVLVAGDDSAAKAAVAELVTAAGLKVIDAGASSRARELEAIGFLQITLAAAEKIAWTGGFGVIA
jgi:predicted dinucleotide-binding enzyme